MNEQEKTISLAIHHKDAFFKKFGLDLQFGQKEYTDSIIKSILLREGKRIVFCVSRQSGKTTANTYIIMWLLLFAHPFWEQLKNNSRKLLEIGVGAPQFSQAKTTFDRLKMAMEHVKEKYNFEYDEANGATMRINNDPYKSIVYVFPVTQNSKIESKSLDIFFGDEMQHMDDERFKMAVLPMLASTFGTVCMTGTAGSRICEFHKYINSTDNNVVKHIHDVKSIIKQKNEMYKLTKNLDYLNYEKHYLSEVKTFGEDSDYIKSQYKLEWILQKGMFVTPKQMEDICLNIPIIKEDKINDVFIGIDCAKENDDMVVTAWRWQMFKRKEWDAPKKCVRVLDWFVLNKELYSDQWEIVEDQFLRNYNISKINIDSTGVGDGTADWFIRRYDNVDYDTYKKRESQGNRGIVRGVKFTPQSKNKMYRELLMLIDNGLFIVPKDEESFGYNKFVKESKILLKEYKGDLLSVHHDDVPGATDDCWDSIACSIYDHDLVPIHGNSKVIIGKFVRDPQLINENKGITEKWLSKRLKMGNKYI